MKRVAVVLSGCGVYDGAEITESVLTLLALEESNAVYQCFAPNVDQHHVINHLSGEEVKETRNVLVEAARIARGDIKDLKEAKAKDFDALIFPGGFGAAKNLSNFAFEGEKASVHPAVAQLVKDMQAANKPVGFICISPAMIPKLYPKGTELTIGTEQETAAKINKMGGHHSDCPVTEIVIDKNNKVVSTPAYMLANRIKEAKQGIDKLVQAVIEMA